MKNKLTKETIAELKRLKETYGKTNAELAKIAGVSETTVRRALKNYTGPELVFPNEIKTEWNGNHDVYDPITKTCIRCGKEFVIPPIEQKLIKKKGYQMPCRCRECREELRKEITLVCCDCGHEFTITQGEKENLEAKGLKAPKRCKSCIGFRREMTLQKARKEAWKSPTFDFDEEE